MSRCSTILAEVVWDISSAARLMATLARRSGLATRNVHIPPPPAAAAHDVVHFDAWMTSAAATGGGEAAAMHGGQYREIAGLLSRREAMVLRFGDEVPARLLGVIGGPRWVSVMAPSGTMHRIRRLEFAALLCSGAEASGSDGIDAFLAGSGLRSRALERARRALLLQRLGSRHIADFWFIRPSPASSFTGELWRTGIWRHGAAYLLASALHYAALLAAWAVIAQWALKGSFAPAWYAEWLLLLGSAAVLSAFCRWCEGVMSVRLNALIKDRLLEGALKMNRDGLRSEGPSHLLGRVLESNMIQTAMPEGVFAALVATTEAAFATAILAFGAGGAMHALAFVLWIALLGAVHFRGYRRREEWARQRVALTHDLVEKMLGNRTRLAQQPSAAWHDGEDEALCHYHRAAHSADRIDIAAEMVAARAWIVVGIAMLFPAIVAGAGAVDLAIAVGGVLLAESALIRYLRAGTVLPEGAVAWRNVRDVLQVAQEPLRTGTGVGIAKVSDGTPVLSAHDVVFRHDGRGVPVIDGCTLSIHKGDRMLLEGESGSGKSTLLALLSGARTPESGIVLLHGLDQGTVGERAWQQRVASTLQFHDNHVFSDSFAFNLLMGRGWPPTADDLREAEAVCEELGLGSLLRRMPGGLFQMIGDYGWQLSHGEQSRLFVGRALLQRADVILLDESFGALDAASLEQSVKCVFRRAPALVVVAHP